MSRVLTKLQDIARSAKHSNPAINPPHIGGTPWLSSTQYPLPGAHPSMTVGNGGNAYALVQPGTSASSGGPTGTSPGLITDGTCKWAYAGPVQAPSISSSNTLPTFTGSSVNYFADGQASLMRYTGGKTSFLSFQEAKFPSVYLGQGNAGACFGNFCSLSNYGATISLMTDAAIIVFATAHGATGNCFRVIVDGRYVSLNQTQIDTSSGFSAYNIVDFTSWGGHHRGQVHRIDFEFPGGGIGFHGIYASSTDTIMPLPDSEFLHPVFFGDSFSSIGQTTYVRGTYGDYTARNLGLPGAAMSGILGTGLIGQGPSNAYPRFFDPELNSPRITDIAGYDFSVVMGGANDLGNSPGDISAAATRFVRGAREAMKESGDPQTPIFFFGQNSPQVSGGSLTTLLQAEDALRVGLEAAHDPMLAFIPMTRRMQPYFTGNGNTASPNGSGNSDYYITSGHPNDAGSAYLGKRVAADILESAARMQAGHSGTVCLNL